MVAKTTVELLDDTDGSKAVETVTFAFEGQQYEIDLNEANVKQIKADFGSWTKHARKIAGSARTRRAPAATKATHGYSAKAVREWAASQKIDVPARGRIPTAVIDQYKAAGN